MSKVEEVAKAIYEADDVWSEAFPWPSMGSKDQSADNYRRIARAAIEAMREPTEEMLTAAIEKIGYEVDWVGGLMGSSYSAGVQVLADGYRASIGAALNEEVAG